MITSTKDEIVGNIDINDVVRKILNDLEIENRKTAAKNIEIKEIGGEVNKDNNKINDEELLFNGCRVISLDDVKRKFEGVQSQKILRVVVSPKCVLTPSAKDELKKRGLEIIVRKINTGNRSLWIALHGSVTVSNSLLTKLQSEYKLVQNRFTDHIEVADEAEKIAGQNKQGIILTQHPATILRTTSLRETLRVILAIDPKQVSIDTKEIDANLMIVPPARINESKILESVQSFLLTYRSR
ncbi:MAG: hypothetical protein LBJ00_14040 [Planctomycetaceae bacterium]|nr:hypothetical protein [Planctomycetaceae bacterium]